MAEQQSLHKAAEVLGVETSTISRRLRDLEQRIGVSLFERHRHGLRPTGAGAIFLAGTRRILNDLGSLLTNARIAGRGESGWLRIGFYVSLSSGPLREALSNYMERFTDVEVRVIDGARHERLNSGELDIILTSQIPSGTHEVLPLWNEDVLVAVSESHRLATQQLITWDDLRRERILFSNRDPGPELRAMLTTRLEGGGAQPIIVETGADRDTMISLVALRRSISLFYASNTGLIHPGVIFRPISETNGDLPARYFACWHGRNDDPALRQFLRLLRSEASFTDHSLDANLGMEW